VGILSIIAVDFYPSGTEITGFDVWRRFDLIGSAWKEFFDSSKGRRTAIYVDRQQ